MLKVILIDDEFIVLKGIEAMLNKQQDIALTIFSYLDAIQALENLGELNPDVIITDINMPELDGLMFIEQAIELGYTGRFIIISGYEKIDYYKRALSMHVMGYLIKPINKEELIDTLQKIEEEKLSNQCELLLRWKLSLTFNACFFDLPTQQAECQLFFNQPYTILFVAQGLSELQTEQVTKQLDQYFPSTHLLRHNLMTFFLCLSNHTLEKSDLRQIWHTVVPEEENNEYIRSGISFSHPTSEILELISRKQCLPLLLEAVCDYTEAALKVPHVFDRLLICTGLDYWTRNMQVMNDIVDQLIQLGINNAFIQGMVITFSHYALTHGEFPDPELMKQLIARRQPSVLDKNSLMQVMLQLPIDYIALSHKDSSTQYSDKIELIVRYMRENYVKDISLTEMAQIVELSANYLSTLFHREVNQTFLDYLHQLRIQAACQLLENQPSLSINEISEMVGYNSIGHFYKTFKSIHGMSPNRWRKDLTCLE